MIPIHHSTAFGLQALTEWADRYLPDGASGMDQVGTVPFYALMAVRQIDAFAIPTFLFVSGFFIAFMAKGENSKVTVSMLWPRIRVLLIPFMIWSIVRFALLLRPPSSIFEWMDQYYYIILLIQLYLLSPLLIPIARNHWLALLVVTGIAQLAVEGLELANAIGIQSNLLTTLTLFNQRWLFVSKLFGFSLGLVVGLHSEAAKVWLYRYRWALLAIAATCVALSLFEYQAVASWSNRRWLGPNNPGLMRIIYASLFALCILAFGDVRWPQSSRLEAVGSKSLGIYLANIPFIYVAAVLMYRLTPQFLGMQFVYQAVLIIVGLLGPLMLMEITRRSPMRRYYKHVFG